MEAQDVSMKHLFSILVPLLITSRIADAIVCMSCPYVPQPHNCTTVLDCGPDTYCFTELDVGAGGQMYYKVGCKDKLFCHSSGRRRSNTNTNKIIHLNSTTTHLNRDTRDRITCQECCDTDLCNTAGCSAKGFLSPRGPICYACAQHKSQTACNQIQECGSDEYCYVEKYQSGNDYLYNTACMAKTMCGTLGITQPTTHLSHGSPILGRSIDEFRQSTWTETSGIEHSRRRGSSVKPRLCCSSDLCNTNDLLVPVDGHWSVWSSWTSCSVTCGSGSMSRSRTCNNPAPKFGGKPCFGGDTERMTCTLQTCSALQTKSSYTCLSCSAAASPRDCNFVQQCGPNSVCYLEKHLTTGGYFTYYSGCRDRQFCKSSVGKRDNGNAYNVTMVTDSDLSTEMDDNFNNDKKMCTECCDGDLCNNKGCGEPGYPSTHGPVCYKCDQQTHPDRCNQITICNTDEACHLTHSRIVGLVYSTGCIKTADCVANGYLNTIPIAGRMVGRRDVSFINSSHDTVSQSATAFQNESIQSQDCVANGYLNTIPIAGRMVGRRDVSFINSSHDTVSQSATAFQNESIQSQVSKDRNKRTVTPCSKCCTSNLCNSDSCQHVQPHATSPPSTASPTTVSTQRQSIRTSVPTPHFTLTPPLTTSTSHVTNPTNQKLSTTTTKHVTSRLTHITPTSPTHLITSHFSKMTTHSAHQNHLTTHKSHMATSSSHVASATANHQTPHGNLQTGQPHSVSSCHNWAAWTVTRTCNEARLLHIGYIVRRRTCLDDNNYEIDKVYCGHYTTKPCVPASIASVTVTMGSWTAGGSVGLECMVQGDPKPTVKWSCSNDCGNLADVFEFDTSLFASGLNRAYSGTYTCIADNQCGHATKDYVATVT